MHFLFFTKWTPLGWSVFVSLFIVARKLVTAAYKKVPWIKIDSLSLMHRDRMRGGGGGVYSNTLSYKRCSGVERNYFGRYQFIIKCLPGR